MEQENQRPGTPSQALRILQGYDEERFSSQHSVSSQSSSSWAGSGSVSSISERRRTNRTPFPLIPVVTEASPLLPRSSRASIARQNSGSIHTEQSQQTLVEESHADWPASLAMSDGSGRPGERMQLKLPRGVLSRSGPTTDVEVIKRVERSIGYRFRNPELLLEALETPGSGMVCVGEGNRPVPHGNKPLAELGKAAMELALMQQYYILNIPKCKEGPTQIARW